MGVDGSEVDHVANESATDLDYFSSGVELANENFVLGSSHRIALSLSSGSDS